MAELEKELGNPDPWDPADPLEIMQVITIFNNIGAPRDYKVGITVNIKESTFQKDGFLVLFRFTNL